MRQLIYNAVTCWDCKETLISYHRHDYKTCSCPNEAMVDGGLDYERYGAKNLDNIILHHYYFDEVNDESWPELRYFATRGSRGKDGKQPLTWIPLKDMDDDYLEAVLDYGGAEWHLELIRKEIEYRKTLQNLPKSGKKSSDKLKGCACYGSNSMHKCNCK